MVDDSIVYVIDDDQAMVESLSWVIESVGLKVKTYTRAPAIIGLLIAGCAYARNEWS
jgi:FixJ family two-component response regulator